MENLLSAEMLVISVFVAYFAYRGFATLLLKWTDVAREELYELGDKIIDKSDIGESQKNLIIHMIGGIFSWSYMFGLIIGIVWGAIKFDRKNHTEAEEIFTSDQLVARFFKLHFITSSAANPIWAILVFFALILATIALIVKASMFYFSEFWLDAVKQASTQKFSINSLTWNKTG